MKCLYCHNNIPSNVKFCPFCGKEVITTQPLLTKKEIVKKPSKAFILFTIIGIIILFIFIVIVVSPRIRNKLPFLGTPNVYVSGYCSTQACAYVKILYMNGEHDNSGDFVINGEIQNTGDRTLAAIDLKAIGYDNNNVEVNTSYIMADSWLVLSGDKSTFSISIIDPERKISHFTVNVVNTCFK